MDQTEEQSKIIENKLLQGDFTSMEPVLKLLHDMCEAAIIYDYSMNTRFNDNGEPDHAVAVQVRPDDTFVYFNL